MLYNDLMKNKKRMTANSIIICYFILLALLGFVAFCIWDYYVIKSGSISIADRVPRTPRMNRGLAILCIAPALPLVPLMWKTKRSDDFVGSGFKRFLWLHAYLILVVIILCSVLVVKIPEWKAKAELYQQEQKELREKIIPDSTEIDLEDLSELETTETKR